MRVFKNSGKLGLDSEILKVLIFLTLMADEVIEAKETGAQEKGDQEEKWPSYTMVEERMRKIYFKFYKETYKGSEGSRIDRKSKELIAIAASLGFNCVGCLEGHVQKALQYGATKEEISEAISIAMGVAAASVVDQTDVVAEKLKIKHFD